MPLMTKPILHDMIFLSLSSCPATKNDLPLARDLAGTREVELYVSIDVRGTMIEPPAHGNVLRYR